MDECLFCTKSELYVNHWMFSLMDRASFSLKIFRSSSLSLIISWSMSWMESWLEDTSFLSTWSKVWFLSMCSRIWFLVWFLSMGSKIWFLVTMAPGYSVGGYPALVRGEEGGAGADGLNWPWSVGLENCIGVWNCRLLCLSPLLNSFSLVDLLNHAWADGIPEPLISMLLPHTVESSFDDSKLLHVLLTVLESLNFL